MFGPEEVLTNWRGAPADQHGIALRAMSDLFEAAAADAYTITCSYVEVYNDTCIDLLAHEKKALPLRELPSGTPFVAGLTEEEVASVDSALSALSRGTARRATAQMSMNARSSRSHAVFSLALRGSAGATDGSTTSGKLVLVDLAGMESSKKSSSVEGASSAGPRREEAKHINTSLYALGTVIERLSVASREGDGAILSHVPFRNSKLTRLLQECLHGNTAPAFIATLRAEPQNLEECMATLRFAQRAKAVPVVVRANVKAAPLDSEALQKELKAVTRELGEAKALIERLQREAHEVHGPRRPVAGTDASDDARESALLMGRLQLGQLAEKMAELIGQSSELSAPPPASEGAAASADVFAGWGVATTPSQAPRAIPTARTAQAKASAAQAQANATAAELLKAQKAIEEAKMQAETALRAERARAAKVVKAAQAEAAETLEKRTAEISKETREWREKAAAEAEKRNKAATKAAAAEAKAEEQAAAAVRERTRANAAEQRLLAEKARADAAEAAAKAADARAASADAERERLTAAAAKAEADAEAADDAAAFAAATVTPRTAAVIEMSRREALALQQLGFIFPELPERKLREALERVDWNLDAAASELIERDIPRQAWDSLWG
ncbi:kinesin heavy chain [Chrysochromulina tobinii]|uniref:Kinesin heavy chain n=1 Tax=Chrysochromulina tobinii TaxID=1460289 RepID=A0A0M0JMI2_9EUKA|nr:kinesin heavy chain [Chrysochromulina tobinii]|eukprot:KOO27512.1 kinesin heavy chain [Chrysochromulina sp. CCMP291]